MQVDALMIHNVTFLFHLLDHLKNDDSNFLGMYSKITSSEIIEEDLGVYTFNPLL